MPECPRISAASQSATSALLLSHVICSHASFKPLYGCTRSLVARASSSLPLLLLSAVRPSRVLLVLGVHPGDEGGVIVLAAVEARPAAEAPPRGGAGDLHRTAAVQARLSQHLLAVVPDVGVRLGGLVWEMMQPTPPLTF